MNSKRLKMINLTMKLGFSFFAVYKIIMMILNNSYSRIMTTFCVFLLVLIPSIIRKLKFEIEDSLEYIYLVFIFLAQILGSVVNLYSSLWWWDLFVHFLSGIFTSYISIIVLDRFKILKNKNKWFNVIFIICFSLAIASCWEFFEFTADKITGGDTQWVIKTGVDDTMEDMLVAFAGSIVFALYYFKNIFKN